ncbi:DUF6241 domain-containing protein [Planococcus lenghuensis]|uniref:CTP synthase n=1 Tax=Planococcus lenghuensis TaxID=2213202 RepID=A0A1Q2KXD9_9BACL|nr:DUF6241 domain-containing protein [Planococcus lenghuensis]AQQ52861.1 hypothetical protein B0X71_07005 [Planococcus lenghuensis]
MKTFKHVVIVLGLIAALAVGGYYYIKQDLASPDELAQTAEEINEREQHKGEVRENDVEVSMEESEVQTYLHQMTHQHVIASEKWGSVESNPQNIENLLTIVQANRNEYEHSAYYIGVLEQWREGNFSNAVSVHNFVWKLQGGTVGKATGLLSEEEKKQFAEENFSD